MSTWVVGDIHGCYDDFMTLLNNSEIKEDDKIILIGDIIDRGPDSVKMLEWAMKNVKPGGRYQMIIGNHEDDKLWEFNYVSKKLGQKPLDEVDISELWSGYGFNWYMLDAGYNTLADLQPVMDWFRQLPLTIQTSDYTPEGKLQKYMIAHAWYSPDMKRDDILFYRDIDLYTNRIKKDFDYASNSDEILIHGHTPTIGIADCAELPTNQVLFREHSINIDTGCVFKEDGGVLSAIRLGDHEVIYSGELKPIVLF